MMQISDEGLEHLIKWEGLELKPYKDVANLWTIGVGHLITQTELKTGNIIINGEAVKWKDGITHQQAKDLLAQDLDRFEKAVNESVEVELTQPQFDTLVSFSFNVGVGAFTGSTLLRNLNKGLYETVPLQLLRWNKAGGRVVRGLTNRRRSEGEMWNGNY